MTTATTTAFLSDHAWTGFFDALELGWTLDTLASELANPSVGPDAFADYAFGATYAVDLHVLRACRYSDTIWILADRANVDTLRRLLACGAIEEVRGAYAITDRGLEGLAAIA